ncbi:MAG: type II methionyl aminopeptidase [Candidatus Korarchaeum sp.]|nr:type II methionyl aminopeptidase [Candidatus Korarchaeum sp.]MDW8035933.1 type II methionyl aminopeptidase [Candidatus Korarchaeum sp.]
MIEVGSLKEEEVEILIRLGEIHSSILESMLARVREGTKLIDIVEESESRIREEGYEPAFPTNISLNQTAAHYTPFPNDESTVISGSIVKLDIGSHSNGLIVDAARTVALDDRYEEMIEVAREAVMRSLAKIFPGGKLIDVSEVIYETIVSSGYKPISNLTGHKIEVYKLHAGVDVPNVPVRGNYRIREGDVFAIEPFVTLPNSKGYVVPLGEPLIFSMRKKVSLRDEKERRVMKLIERSYSKLPFCERWFVKEIGTRVNDILLRLVRRGVLTPYPPLVEVSGRLVAQYEDTVLVTSEGPINLTGGL